MLGSCKFLKTKQETDMCRWMGYTGNPIFLEELLIKPTHSLVVQSLSSTEGVENTNGDGFGIGWYGTEQPTPGVYKNHLNQVGTIEISPRSPNIFVPPCLSPMLVQPRAHRFSRQIATHSTTKTGFSYITAYCGTTIS